MSRRSEITPEYHHKPTEQETALFKAVEQGKLEEVVRLIEQENVDINAADEHGAVALGYALAHARWRGMDKIIDYLLHRPTVNVNLANKEGRTLLMSAAERGGLDVVEKLLKQGAEINAADAKGRTALMWIATKAFSVLDDRAEIVAKTQMLIAYGARINLIGGEGKSVLMHALEDQRSEIITVLLEAGVQLPTHVEGRKKILQFAADKGHVELLTALLRQAGFNLTDLSNGPVAFFSAVNNNHFGVAQILIDSGVGVDVRDSFYQEEVTALMCAAGGGKFEPLSFLLRNGANINAVSSRGRTALMLATNLFRQSEAKSVATIRVLLNAGANINVIDEEGETALIHALRAHNASAVTVLLEAGAQLHTTAESRKKIFQLAASEGHVELLTALVKQKDFDLNDSSGDATLLQLAVQNNRMEAVQFLILSGVDVNATDKEGNTALMLAAKNGLIEITRILLERGATVNTRNKEGNTALMMVGSSNHTENALQSRAEVAKILLSAGAEVNARNEKARTALMLWATAVKNPEQFKCITQILIEGKADLNARDREGRTALRHAISAENTGAVLTLIEVGADMNLKDGEEVSALMMLEKSESMFKAWDIQRALAIAEAYKDQDGKNKFLRKVAEGFNNEVLAKLIENGAELNAADEQGKTALLYAAGSLNVEGVKLLMRHGANIKLIDRQGKGALIHAWEGERRFYRLTACAEIIAMLIEAGIDLRFYNITLLLRLVVLTNNLNSVKILIGMGAEVNAADEQGKTALIHHVLSKNGDLDIARYLIQAGANINTTDCTGKTPLQYLTQSSRCYRAQLISELIEAGADLTGINKEETLVNLAELVKNRKAIQILIEKGAKVNAVVETSWQTLKGGTALLGASRERWREPADIELVKYLIKQGADVNASTQYGTTALMVAVEQKNVELAWLLIREGADVNATNTEGKSILLQAIQKRAEEMVNVLLEAGADVHKKEFCKAIIETRESPVFAPALIGILFNSLPAEERTQLLTELLVFAARRGYFDLLTLALEAGAKVNMERNIYEHPLALVAARGDLKSIVALAAVGENLLTPFEEFSRAPRTVASYLVDPDFAEAISANSIHRRKAALLGRERIRQCATLWQERRAEQTPLPVPIAVEQDATLGEERRAEQAPSPAPVVTANSNFWNDSFSALSSSVHASFIELERSLKDWLFKP